MVIAAMTVCRASVPYLAIAFLTASPAYATDIQTCFTPGEDCIAFIAAALDGAKQSLLVQEYELTSPELAQSIIAAQKRGVSVRVILDRSQRSSHSSSAKLLAKAGLPVAIDDQVAGIAHNKIAVIDAETVIGGSFNWTGSAQGRNAENVLLIKDAALAAKFTENFERRAAVSTPYRKRRGRR